MAETTAELIARGERVLVGNYGRQPLAPVRGEGVHLEDAEGRRYLDFIGGIAVSTLGHGHPALGRAIAAQAQAVLHVSNLYWIEPQVRLAEQICETSFAERVLFCNSGAEANEGAVKMARRHFYDRGEAGRVGIVSAHGGFHGRTLAMLAATGTPKYREGFGPMPAGFSQVAYGDLEALRGAVGAGTAAVFLEPVQGEGGVVVPPPGYFAGVREICDAAGALLILDEVQLGVGRSGRMYGYEHEGITPDIMTLAKGLGGGVPIGAVAATQKVARALVPGTHGTTFGGNYLACAAGNAVMDVVRAPGFLEGVTARGEQLFAGLEKLAQSVHWASGVRGRGLLVGLELAPGYLAAECIAAARAKGLLVGAATPHYLRFAPPLVVREDEIDQALSILHELGDLQPSAG